MISCMARISFRPNHSGGREEDSVVRTVREISVVFRSAKGDNWTVTSRTVLSELAGEAGDFVELLGGDFVAAEAAVEAGDVCRARLRMAHSFNRVGNAPRFVFQISNLKFQIRNFRQGNRGPLGTRLNLFSATLKINRS